MPALSRGSLRNNSIRLLVEEEQAFSFCIHEDEPHILRIRLQRSGGHTVLNSHRGGRCRPVELQPGNDRLQYKHDKTEQTATVSNGAHSGPSVNSDIDQG